MSMSRSASTRARERRDDRGQHARSPSHAREAMFDAEHFFDGYKANPGYALDCLKAARARPARAGSCSATPMAARCRMRSSASSARSPTHIPGDQLGIHCHNDTENAVANSLAAVRAGARQVQGTLNGLGERCGNANLVSLIPTLDAEDSTIATGVGREGLAQLTQALAPARRAAEPRAPPPRRLCRRVALSRIRAGCMSRRSRRIRAPTSMSTRRWSAITAHIVVSDQSGPRQYPGPLARDRPRGRRRRSEARRAARDGEGARIRGLCL